MRIVSRSWVFALLATGLVGTFGAAPAYAVLAFSNETRLSEPSATGPFGVASADFDGDGKADIVLANKNANSITILLGDGTGTFTQWGPSIAVGSSPVSVAVGNCGNGNQSIFVANTGSSNVTVLKNTTSGGVLSFAAPVNYAAGTKPVFVLSKTATGAALDVNGDTKLDLVTANKTTDHVSVMLGNGDCTFGAANSNATGGNGPETVTAGDFNGDGKVDLAVTNRLSPAGITILINDGTGNFPSTCSAPTCYNYTDCGTPSDVVAGYLDGPSDTVLDLLVTDAANDVICRKSGNGNGTFGASSTFATNGQGPEAVVVGEFDGNTTALDAVTINTGGNSISFMKGLASANFNPGVTTALNSATPGVKATGPQDIAAFMTTSLNVVTANNTTSNYSSCVNNGTGGFSCTPTAANPSGYGSGPRGIAIGNVSGTSANDLVIANEGSNDITVVLGDGAGGFTTLYKPPQPVNTADLNNAINPRDVTILDADGSGNADLAIAACGGSGQTKDRLIVVRDLHWDNTAAPYPQSLSAGDCPTAVAVGDLNGDSLPDIVVANQNWNSLSVFKNTGGGTYAKQGADICINGGTPPTSCGTCYPTDVAIGEFGTDNGNDATDNLPDVVVTCKNNDNMTVFFSNGSFGFKPGIDQVNVAASGQPQALVLGDFGGSSKLDIAVANHNTGASTVGTAKGVQVFVETSPNNFNNSQNLDAGKQPTAIASGDLGSSTSNRPSLVATSEGSDQVALFEGRGLSSTPVFEPALTKLVGTNPKGVALGNLDADPKLDVAVTNNGTSDVSVLFNQSPVCGDNTTTSPEACDPAGSSCNTGCGTGTCTVTCRCSP